MRLGLLVAAIVVVADQALKAMVVDQVMADGRTRELAPFLNLVIVWNRGVSFGIFNKDWGGAPWALSAVAVAIVVLLTLWLARQNSRVTAAGIGLIIGGAVGNVVDRARFGAVFDFIDFHLGGWHWPAFNLADSAITLGVIVLLVDSLFRGRQSSN